MQENRKDLERRSVEKAAGRNSGAGLSRLRQLHAAEILEDLRIPPSNRLESLSGDLKGFWSMRINQQWRLVFRWNEGKASDVKITDYH